MSKRLYILFVCNDNSLLSQMAEAIVKLYRENEIVAYSAGIKPVKRVSEHAYFLMERLGYYNMQSHTTKCVSNAPDFHYDFVITLGTQEFIHQVEADKRLEWRFPDTSHLSLEELARISDLLQSRVMNLVTRAAA